MADAETTDAAAAADDGMDCLVGTALHEDDAQWARAVLVEDRETRAAVRPLAGAGNWGVFVAECSAEAMAPLMYYTAGAIAMAARFRRNAHPGK